jgi:phosphatidylethanolamine/phosphatidyl-N-methylethanolamine N-methyltransferase
MRNIGHRIKFIRQFISSPKHTGAISPSSRFLARRMVDGLGIESAEVVVEAGPGTGVFTTEILPRLAEGADFHAIEMNPAMAKIFKKRHPSALLHLDSAVNIGSLLAEHGHNHTDVIVSGLPWAAFDESLQDELLDAMLGVLRPGGAFATFAYLQGLLLPAGKRFRAKLHQRFSEVKTTPAVWLNIPPAIVYQCRY